MMHFSRRLGSPEIVDHSLQHVLLAIGSGSLIGCTLGLIGGGGSILATPLLLYVVGVRDAHTAIGTGALAVSANAYLNLASHAAKGHVRWRCGSIFALAGALGAYFGSSIGKLVDGQSLLFMFGLLMLFVGFAMRRVNAQTGVTAASLTLRIYIKVASIAFLVGFASGFFGIGGGFLIVPGLVLSTGMPLTPAGSILAWARSCRGFRAVG
ncbi:TSUP family transporter [Agrobacterium leguminum]|uniref:TSUP family transporter n=1 Tax=Agrobacterium leguminum TaxID=2792015 RepID=UPI003F739730